MKQFDREKNVVFLILIHKNPSFSIADNLIKILSWWFNILDYSELLGRLVSKGYITRDSNQIGNYEMTQYAKDIFIDSKDDIIKQIKEHYPEKVDKIEILSNQ